MHCEPAQWLHPCIRWSSKMLNKTAWLQHTRYNRALVATGNDCHQTFNNAITGCFPRALSHGWQQDQYEGSCLSRFYMVEEKGRKNATGPTICAGVYNICYLKQKHADSFIIMPVDLAISSDTQLHICMIVRGGLVDKIYHDLFVSLVLMLECIECTIVCW